MNSAQRENRTAPTIAVIVPVYNAEPYLARAVDSILAQTYSNLEIWLIDDGSTDGSPAICDAYAQKDPRIHVVHQQNAGLSVARNAGLDRTKAEYVALLDADDEMLPEMLAELMATLQESGADIVQCEYAEYSETEDRGKTIADAQAYNNEKKKWRGYREGKKFWKMYEDLATIVQWNKLYRATIFQGLRYPEGKYHEDEFIICEELKNAGTLVHLPRKLHLYHRHKESITMKPTLRKKCDAMEALIARMRFFAERGEDELLAHTCFMFDNYVLEWKKEMEQYPDREAWGPYFDELVEKGQSEAGLRKNLNIGKRLHLLFKKMWLWAHDRKESLLKRSEESGKPKE